MEYKITLKKQLKALQFMSFLVLFYIGMVVYFGYKDGFDNDLLNFFMIILLVSVIPVLFLHVEYYICNVGTNLKINTAKKQIIYTNKAGVTEIFAFDDIKEIIEYMPPSMYRKSNFQLLPFEQYHFASIYTKNGKQIIITCLMAENIDNMINEITNAPVERVKMLFATILITRLKV